MTFGDVDHQNEQALASYDRLAEAGPDARRPLCIILGCEDEAGEDRELCEFHLQLVGEGPFA